MHDTYTNNFVSSMASLCVFCTRHYCRGIRGIGSSKWVDCNGWRVSLQCVKRVVRIIVKIMKLVSLNGDVHNFTCRPLWVILKLPFNRANPPPTPPKAAKSYSQQKNYYTSKTSKSVFRECKWRDVICCLLYSTDMFVMHETGGLLKSRFSCGP